MKNKQKKQPLLTEDELVSLLHSLKVEPSPEADFEGRFLHDFRNRLVQQAAIRPVRELLWERVLLKITNFGKLKWAACGATSLGLGVLAVGLLTWDSDDNKMGVGKVEAFSPTAWEQTDAEVNVKASASVESTRVVTPAVVRPVEAAQEQKEEAKAEQAVSE